MASPPAPAPAPAPPRLPRVTIHYCTQCKWMLRAAYFAQELLSTFSTALGEVALQPGTGGVFTVTIETRVPDGSDDGSSHASLTDERAESAGHSATGRVDNSGGHSTARSTEASEGHSAISVTEAGGRRGGLVVHQLWDRRSDGGFPEVKELKRRVRDVVAPGRDLGHVDGHRKSVGGGGTKEKVQEKAGGEETEEREEKGNGTDAEEEKVIEVEKVEEKAEKATEEGEKEKGTEKEEGCEDCK